MPQRYYNSHKRQKDLIKKAENSNLKTSNGNATHNFIVVSNKICLSRFPYWEGGTWCLLRLPDVHLYCLVLLYMFV